MPFILLFILLFFLFGCNSSEYRNENDALSENGEDESYETLEKGYCFYCGKKYDTRYIIDVANQEIELCKPCRDSLLVNNGAITVDGSTFYPFANVNLYQDDLVTIVIPDDYRQTDVEYGDYYQAQFDYKEIEGIFYLFDWQDMMPFEHTMSDRMGYGFAEIDTTELLADLKEMEIVFKQKKYVVITIIAGNIKEIPEFNLKGELIKEWESIKSINED